MDFKIFTVCADVGVCDCTRGVYGESALKADSGPLPHWVIEPASAACRVRRCNNWATSPEANLTKRGYKWMWYNCSSTTETVPKSRICRSSYRLFGRCLRPVLACIHWYEESRQCSFTEHVASDCTALSVLTDVRRQENQTNLYRCETSETRVDCQRSAHPR